MYIKVKILKGAYANLEGRMCNINEKYIFVDVLNGMNNPVVLFETEKYSEYLEILDDDITFEELLKSEE